jgi:hypothetical protein
MAMPGKEQSAILQLLTLVPMVDACLRFLRRMTLYGRSSPLEAVTACRPPPSSGYGVAV